MDEKAADLLILGTALDNTVRTYRRSLWDQQDAYVEIWLEKDALSGVLYDVTAEWDVPLMVTRGYPSLSYLHVAAETIADEDRPCLIYYFGDHDPSGVDIPRKVEADLRTFAVSDADLWFSARGGDARADRGMEVAYAPYKENGHPRWHFEGESVEVDAIPPATSAPSAAGASSSISTLHALEQTQLVEQAERDTLRTILDNLQGDAP